MNEGLFLEDELSLLLSEIMWIIIRCYNARVNKVLIK